MPGAGKMRARTIMPSIDAQTYSFRSCIVCPDALSVINFGFKGSVVRSQLLYSLEGNLVL